MSLGAFAARTSTALWRSSLAVLSLTALCATASGIEISKVDKNTAGSALPDHLADVASQVVAAATSGFDREIHIIDPTTVDPIDSDNVSTTVNVDPAFNSFPAGIAETGDLAFFSATMSLANRELYVVDPLVPGAGATAIDINPAGSSNPELITEVTAVAGDLAVMRATTAAAGTEFFVVDPTNLPGGATLVDINVGAGSSTPSGLISVDERAVFSATNDGTDIELHVVDPHMPGLGATEVEINVGGSSSPAEIIGVGDLAVFRAFDGTDTEVYVVDPSMPGLGATKVDINPSGSSLSQFFVSAGGRAVFRAFDPTNGAELHILDPTAPGAGTVVVNINENPFGGSFPEDVTSVAGRAVFTADDGTGRELHVVDPLSPDDTLEKIPILASGVTGIDEITDVAGRAVFRASSGGDVELYVVDPLFPEYGWVRIDVNPSGSSSPEKFTDVAGHMAFSAFVGGNTDLYILSFETNWDSQSSGDWDNAASWRGGIAPRMIDDVVIAPENGLTVTGPSEEAAVASVTVGATSGTATLSLSTGTIRTHSATINAGGRLTGNGTLATDTDLVINHGTIDLGGGLQVDGGPLENHGDVLGGTGSISATLNNEETGRVRADEGDRAVFTGIGNTNLGEIILLGGTVEFRNDLLNERMGADNGLISGRGTLFVDGGLTNDGVMNFSGGLTNVFGDVDNTASGEIVNAGGSTLTFFDDVVNNGNIRTTIDSTIVFFGDFSGGGALAGGGTASFEGDLSPGNSAGLLSFGSNVELQDSSSLIIEVGGTGRGSEYDALDVEGTVSLDGTLEVALADFGNGLFQPRLGDEFLLIASDGGITGQFTAAVLPSLGSQLQWQLDATASQLALAVELEGDFNRDGIVNAADYIVWRNSDGQSGALLPADADADGSVGAGDYERWRANFGLTAAGLGTGLAAAVPEPGTLMLFLVGIATLGLGRPGPLKRPRP